MYTKEALLKILEDIKEEDYINFVLFGSKVHKWKDTLIKATPENLAEARRYVQRISIAGCMFCREMGYICLIVI
ncbi:hypothetical protein E2320_015132 [Naja naja]|nr:hypothetical protein E2320_015132 [Naja naja]